jgi:PPM family protein phosphatase
VTEAFGFTDQGRVRRNNEDSFFVDPELGLYLVADGMGGANAGEYASRLAVETVSEGLRQGPRNPEQLERCIREANRKILDESAADARHRGMGTTLVAALWDGGALHLASVGDSRAYLWEDRRLQQLTEDQTWVHEIGRKLGLEEGVLKCHPLRHVLTMALGATADLRIQMREVRPRAGSLLLLCSDGLHGPVDEEFLSALLSSPITLADRAHSLIEAANEAGGPDNVTAVLVKL